MHLFLRCYLKILYAIALLSVASIAHSKEIIGQPPCTVNPALHQPFGNAGTGLNPDSAVPLPIQPGEKLNLSFKKTTNCYVAISPVLPVEITLSLKGGDGSNWPRFSIRTVNSDPIIAIAHSEIKENDAIKASAKLRPGNYIVQVEYFDVSKEKSERHFSSDFILSVEKIRNDTPTFPALAGEVREIKFSPTSSSDYYLIDVKYRSILQWALGAPPFFRLSEEKGPWSPNDSRPLVSFGIRKMNGDSAWLLEKRPLPALSSIQYSYILNPGKYIAEINMYDEKKIWPKFKEMPLSESSEITISLIGVSYNPMRNELMQLGKWFEDVGLGAALSPLDIIDFRQKNSEQNMQVRSEMIEGAMLATAHRENTKNNNAKLRPRSLAWQRLETGLLAGTLLSSNYATAKDVPDVAVLLDTNLDRFQMEALENEFKEMHGITLWQKIIQKVAAALGLPSRKVILHVPVVCSGEWAFSISGGDASRYGSFCVSASFGTTLPVPIKKGVLSGSQQLPLSTMGIGPSILAFLQEYLKVSKREINALTLDPDFAEVIVRGLKGRTIHGGSLWERLQISFFVTQAPSGPFLRASIDGRVASGLGAYPPDSQFTDMEPQYTLDLTEFTRSLTVAFKDYLSKKEKEPNRD
ncbi:hypothetical protein [Crenobacter cavernae]|uniref:hypothetical protein n=1 Tax=Crenobacter cavernae TaxID=2290923 RepID=UPI0011C063D2|nr:hypothetical protein [Crenobacter cavernae]